MPDVTEDSKPSIGQLQAMYLENFIGQRLDKTECIGAVTVWEYSSPDDITFIVPCSPKITPADLAKAGIITCARDVMWQKPNAREQAEAEFTIPCNALSAEIEGDLNILRSAERVGIRAVDVSRGKDGFVFIVANIVNPELFWDAYGPLKGVRGESLDTGRHVIKYTIPYACLPATPMPEKQPAARSLMPMFT